ncbi:MAG: ice-binding family protein [Phycisphaerae bacterium]|nr:ice-binding family protein [Phycisphaerae bacterium]
MKRFLIIATAFLVVAVAAIGTSQATINLGAATNFAVLGGSGVTCAGTGALITGDVGSSPTQTVDGITASMVTGNLYLAGESPTLKAQAHADANLAYGILKAMTGAQDLTGLDLGGRTLNQGVYKYTSTANWTAGTLTLDGQSNPNAQWVFQIGTGLTTPEGAIVSLINGASASNVFWQVGSSATIGGTNTFAGTILADQSITLGGGTLTGRALAINALVSIPTMTTINIPEPATITLLCTGAFALLKRKSSK